MRPFEKALWQWTMTKSSIFQRLQVLCIILTFHSYVNPLTLSAGWEPRIKPRIEQDSSDTEFPFESQTDVEDSATRPRKRQ